MKNQVKYGNIFGILKKKKINPQNKHLLHFCVKKKITGFMLDWFEDFRDVTVALTCTGNTQGEVGWGSEHPDPVQDVPAHGRGWIR